MNFEEAAEKVTVGIVKDWVKHGSDFVLVTAIDSASRVKVPAVSRTFTGDVMMLAGISSVGSCSLRNNYAPATHHIYQSATFGWWVYDRVEGALGFESWARLESWASQFTRSPGRSAYKLEW